ncbi:MAG: dephospho-CoA kinase [Steroidobacteraceae bacterium]
MARADALARTPFRVALTGGIASGKSTVAALFQALGAGLIDTDLIAREIVLPGSPAFDEIVARFGPGVLAPGGALDRARLRDLVFRDAAARADLEAITHPKIHAEVARRSREAQEPYLLVAVPLLAETGTAKHYDRVLVVDAPPAAQQLRLMQRDRIDADAAARMLAAQASREARLSLADDVIRNEGDISRLAGQVEALHKTYLGRQGYAK